MNPHIPSVYKGSLGLLTDLYQLTMANGYWQTERYNREAVFHLFFRKHPFGGNYTVACGLQTAIEYLQNIHFTIEDIQYLASLKGGNKQPIFEESFLNYLQRLTFTCDVDAVPEGTIVQPHEPIMRVRGPLLQVQLVETALLNILNFQTLIATKAARVVAAAENDTVIEFGLRRAQGIDGGIAASRAAYIGGCHGTSNVLAGKLFHIPVRGTHAHSWVMAYPSEFDAFKEYAAAMPNNCIFLVDTYDTIQGVKNAIAVGKKLQKRGARLIGVRLDSGDLVTLSQAARKLLDEAGMQDALVAASNDLDEYEIARLKAAGAQISLWGVGTKLVTAYDQPALGGVYKLGAIRDDKQQWTYAMKFSEDIIKVSNPGILQVARVQQRDGTLIDVLYDEELGFNSKKMVLLNGQNRNVSGSYKPLLQPIMRNGNLVYNFPSTEAIRANTLQEMAAFNAAKKHLFGLDTALWQRKKELMEQHKLKINS